MVINCEDVVDILLYFVEYILKKLRVFELFNGDKLIDSFLNDWY